MYRLAPTTFEITGLKAMPARCAYDRNRSMPIARASMEIHRRLVAERAEEALLRQGVADDFARYFDYIGRDNLRQIIADSQARHDARDAG